MLNETFGSGLIDSKKKIQNVKVVTFYFVSDKWLFISQHNNPVADLAEVIRGERGI